MAEGYNDASDEVVKMWNEDWKLYFEDVCTRTGLTLAQAIQFRILLGSLTTTAATSFLAQKAHEGGKEPWEK